MVKLAEPAELASVVGLTILCCLVFLAGRQDWQTGPAPIRPAAAFVGAAVVDNPPAAIHGFDRLPGRHPCGTALHIPDIMAIRHNVKRWHVAQGACGIENGLTPTS